MLLCANFSDMGKKIKAKWKQKRKGAQAARWSGQDVASEEESDSQQQEAAVALLELQGLGTAANNGGASQDSTQDGPALEGNTGDGVEPGWATPPIPLFLDQDDPGAFHAAVGVLQAHRDRLSASTAIPLGTQVLLVGMGEAPRTGHPWNEAAQYTMVSPGMPHYN